MNKNTLTGFVLIALVLIGFSWWSQKEAVKQQEAAMAEQARLDSIAKANPKQEEPVNDSIQALAKLQADSARVFFAAMAAEQEGQSVVLKNGKVELTLDTKGGVVKKAKVLGYKDYKGNADVTLFDKKDQDLTFILPAKKENISTAELNFTPTEVTDCSATLTAEGADGARIVMKYSLGDSYLLHFSISTEGMSGLF